MNENIQKQHISLLGSIKVSNDNLNHGRENSYSHNFISNSVYKRQLIIVQQLKRSNNLRGKIKLKL